MLRRALGRDQPDRDEEGAASQWQGRRPVATVTEGARVAGVRGRRSLICDDSTKHRSDQAI